MSRQIINPKKTNHPFAPIPNWLARRDEISWNAKGVYARLCQYADENGIAYPLVSTLAKECGLQQPTCERALKELRDNGMILLTERTIVFPLAFIKITNSHTAAILLAQIKHWCSKKERFYKTNDEFCAELFMGINEFRAAKKRLVDLGFITTEIRGMPATTYYSYNEEKVHEALLKTAETLDKSS